MAVSERRRSETRQDPDQMRAGLLPAQLQTLQTLEHFHWQLRFVRRPLFRTPVPLVCDEQGERFVLIEEDGTLNENPPLRTHG